MVTMFTPLNSLASLSYGLPNLGTPWRSVQAYHKYSTFLKFCFFFLLEGSGLVGLVVPFVLTTWELLDHVCTELALIFFFKHILLPSLLLNIKSRYQIFN